MGWASEEFETINLSDKRLIQRAALLAEASELIDWYRASWEIKMFFDILKNACKIEKLHLKTMPKLEMAIALYMVVAWHIVHLMRWGRECPELKASLVFEPDEWMAAYILSEKEPPNKVPTVNKVVRLIASVGDFRGERAMENRASRRSGREWNGWHHLLPG